MEESLYRSSFMSQEGKQGRSYRNLPCFFRKPRNILTVFNKVIQKTDYLISGVDKRLRLCYFIPRKVLMFTSVWPCFQAIMVDMKAKFSYLKCKIVITWFCQSGSWKDLGVQIYHAIQKGTVDQFGIARCSRSIRGESTGSNDR